MLNSADLQTVARMLEEPVATAPSRRFSCLINQANKDTYQDLTSDWLTGTDIEDVKISLTRHMYTI